MNNMHVNEVRSQIIYQRTYSREIPIDSGNFETKEDTIERVIQHQKWLWERAQNRPLSQPQIRELAQLKLLMLDNKVMVSGRTLWMGGTDISRKFEATQFNCSALNIESVFDVVDALWLLLLGAGVGFKPRVGSLTGFTKPIKDIQVVRSSKKPGEKGNPNNTETWDAENKVWVIKVGDSSEAWAKSIGKLLAGKHPARKLVLDFSEVRCAGTRLTNFGWISSGDENISKAYYEIAQILNKKAGSLLNKINIMDIMNHLGTSLSSRRSAQICFIDYESNEWEEFAVAKKDYWLTGNPQRAQSNNSILFYKKPSKLELKGIFDKMIEAGGSEPGFINALEAERKAPWFVATNPCFTGDQRLLTANGYTTLKDAWYEQGQANYGDSYKNVKVLNRNGIVDATQVYKTGENIDVFEVKFKSGRSIKATANHSFILSNETRVQLKDLEVSDEVHLVNSQQFGNKHSPAYAQLAGLFIGDGSFTNNTAELRFWNSDIQELDAIVSNTMYKFYEQEEGASSIGVPKTQFKLVPKFKPNFGYHVAKLKSGTLSSRLKSDGILVGDKHRVPHSIWNSDRETVAHFITGLFSADGHFQYNANKQCGAIVLTQVNRKLLEEVQLLLQQFEVQSYIIPCQKARKSLLNDGKGGKKLYESKASWRLMIGKRESISNFMSNTPGFLQYSKCEKVINYLNRHKGSRNSGNKWLDEVVEINYLGKEDTYCLTEPKNNEVVINGVVVGQCAEILLPSKGFCNLGEINLAKFRNDTFGLHAAAKLIARANYRQTCVDLRDGILQESWHLNNEFLRLCGIGLTGIAQRPDMGDYDYYQLERVVTMSAYSMADELDMPRPKNVTCVKPSGSLSKLMGCTEGMHKPLAKYIFNNVVFARTDPLVEKLRNANYTIMDHPLQAGEVIITLPVSWEDVEFDKVVVDGKTLEVNLDSAVKQLEKYKQIQNNWTHQNTSVTISYSPNEVPAIINWLHNNWDSYVGVSFIYRTDPTKTPEELGYSYLPQQPVSKENYYSYVNELKEIDWNNTGSDLVLQEAECSGGACPVR